MPEGSHPARPLCSWHSPAHSSPGLPRTLWAELTKVPRAALSVPALLAAIAWSAPRRVLGSPAAMKDVALSLLELLAGRSLGRRLPFLGHWPDS